MTPPLRFTVEATCGAARAGRLVLPHGAVPTPAFMAVGTRGTVKACTPDQVAATGTRVMLGNTFHLMLRPGAERIRDAGGLHAFARWPHPMLTDSGGFQVFSLSALREVTEEGVRFKSPYDGASVLLTPERATEVQNLLGADMFMCFDECPPYPCARDDVARAVERTTRWARRCAGAHRRPDAQALFGIVQGGVHPDLREQSAAALLALDLPGYAIGGLSVGEGPELMDACLTSTARLLPADRPRYLMGVGKPEDIVRAVLRGVDLFDCALPTRNGRNAEVYVWPRGRLRLRTAAMTDDHRPIDPLCDCLACGLGVQRSALRHLFKTDEVTALTYGSLHNLRYYQQLMARLRREVLAGTLDAFARGFLATAEEADGGSEPSRNRD